MAHFLKRNQPGFHCVIWDQVEPMGRSRSTWNVETRQGET